jgi:hypothetical protein
MKMQIIPKEKFTEAFEKLGWDCYVSQDQKYIVWTFKKNTEIWTLVPRDDRSGEYLKYQEQNINLILFSLNVEVNDNNFNKIYEQLLGYHYPIINRLTSKTNNFDSGIPLDLADTLINKISSSFLNFRKSQDRNDISNLRFGHTQHGSFILKILVPVKEDEQNTLFEATNETRIEIEQYLNRVQELTRIQTSDPQKYAKFILEKDITSGMVEDFVGRNGIVEIMQKYLENKKIQDIYLSSENNNLLEFNKKDREKFPEIDLYPLKPVSENFIKAVKETEKSSEFEIKEAEIIGTIHAINEKGTAMFEIESVNGRKEQIEKAQTTELTEERVKKCYQAGADKKKLKIIGDIKKHAGKTAKIVVGNLDFFENDEELLV